MEDLIQIIRAWPIIVQGALGSALFWITLLVGQKVTTVVSAKYSKHSLVSRKSWLVSAQLRLEGATTKDYLVRTACTTSLLMRACRELFKALMWLSLGLTLQSSLGFIGVIGFVGCLYYLFKGYAVIGPVDLDQDLHAQLVAIEKELHEIT